MSPATLMPFEIVDDDSQEEHSKSYQNNESDELPKHLDATENTANDGGKPTNGSTYYLRTRIASPK